ncbi:MAG: pyruvate formate lyase-activating protein [Planctomycetota bacterium]|nr:MAG: pyruvate formate lyase-activating protein [Planctomycetota bacterium]
MSSDLRIHSMTTLGCADGPGLRLVVFTQGCPLDCGYCHNPDTRSGRGGTALSLADFAHRVRRTQAYFGAHGGVTFSGGEPLAQAAAILPMLQWCREQGIHTVVDTAGFVLSAAVRALVDAVDMVILDVKHSQPEGFRQLTGGELSRTLDFLDYCSEQEKPLWIRQVIVPTITDDPEQVQGLGDLLCSGRRRSSIARVELLPYHRMGLHKYQEMGMEYPLEHIPEADPQVVAELAQLLVERGLPMRTGAPTAKV